ncbi:hypothetical protein K435DRAFT_851758 [Dendrothele bispora CBS 962.96]|uniref:Uncharacterized protein n=1 Tax=Dendrothele bispora (strain CBS 962.96) TaxID=1314807 RepID=A0A4S8ML74_DENBC|nr:hypothetical protein K435DRAFT_851758 [Dendrothele bispora CBS 962.96]
MLSFYALLLSSMPLCLYVILLCSSPSMLSLYPPCLSFYALLILCSHSMLYASPSMLSSFYALLLLCSPSMLYASPSILLVLCSPTSMLSLYALLLYSPSMLLLLHPLSLSSPFYRSHVIVVCFLCLFPLITPPIPVVFAISFSLPFLILICFFSLLRFSSSFFVSFFSQSPTNAAGESGKDAGEEMEELRLLIRGTGEIMDRVRSDSRMKDTKRFSGRQLVCPVKKGPWGSVGSDKKET